MEHEPARRLSGGIAAKVGTELVAQLTLELCRVSGAILGGGFGTRTVSCDAGSEQAAAADLRKGESALGLCARGWLSRTKSLTNFGSARSRRVRQEGFPQPAFECNIGFTRST